MADKLLDDNFFAAPGHASGALDWTGHARPADRPSHATDRIRENYRRATDITGPLTTPRRANVAVQFRHVATPAQLVVITLFVLGASLFGLRFLVILLQPGHNPGHLHHADLAGAIAAWSAYLLLILLEALRLVQSSTLGLFALSMRDPLPMVPEHGLRVAVLTTIVPDKEPVELVAKTLAAMRKLTYAGIVDVWILDEGDDPDVRRLAAALGVHHFSRKGRPEYNQLNGAYRRRCKAGNHNAWRVEHEAEYDIVAQMDPDHVPSPDFLMRTLGYFRDPDVAYVVAPQVYGNLADSFVVDGAADQSYVFHGVLQRGGNRFGAPLLIGTNHLYRVEAWRQIGGYQDSVIEDHLTGMRVHATRNPQTGHHWKGVYTPDVLSIGEGPRSWTDYFNQQYRWAYGIWEILLHHSPRLLRQLPRKRAIAYLCHQSYYPSVAALWWISPFIAALYLVFGQSAIDISWSTWLWGWLPAVAAHLGFFIYLRRFNLVAHERRGIGLTGMLLTQAAGPIYAFAALGAVLRRRYSYIVTAKAEKASTDSFGAFRRHSYWTAAGLLMLIASHTFHHGYRALQFWAAFLVVSASLPVILFIRNKARARTPQRQRASSTTDITSAVGFPEPSFAFVDQYHRPLAGNMMATAPELHYMPNLPATHHDDRTEPPPKKPATKRQAFDLSADAFWSLIQSDIHGSRSSPSHSGW